jgi:multidrug efflux pump subunit AcrB
MLFGIVAFGLISLSQLRYSFFPEINPDMIVIQVAYPGASPDEVAEGVVLKIEENLDGLQGVDRVTSVSRENSGMVMVEITKGSDLDKVLADVKNAVDRINSFPDDAEKPVIYEQKFMMRSLSVILFGETDLYNLKYIAERFRDDLLATDEISQVEIEGLPNLELSIEISEADLRRYYLTFDEIAAAVRTANINISGGKLDTDDEEILIRAWGRDYYARELSDIIVRGNPDGSVIYLKDVASIKEQWEDIPSKRYYNGRNALVLNLDQSEEEDIIAIAEKTREMIAEFNANHNTVQAMVLDDRTVPLRERLQLLIKNGIIGLTLVIMALGFFLNLRLSFWVAVSIPFSFAGMFIVANLWGITINAISLFGMIIVVGILVDDAIVVAENVYAKFEQGIPIYKAAVDGAMEVLAPVTTSVLTTVIAFLPFFFIDGRVGKIIWHIALVVIASLLFSLVEAFLILPSHLAHSKGFRAKGKISDLRKNIDGYIRFLIHKIYAPVLKTTLKYKWITMVMPVALVMMTVGLLGGGFIGATFFPIIDGDTMPINLSLVSGRQEADTDTVLARIEQVCWQVNEELKEEREDGLNVIEGIKRDLGDNDFGESGSHAGRLTLQLLEGETRQMETYLIANRIREALGPVPEAENINFGRAGHFGKAISSISS